MTRQLTPFELDAWEEYDRVINKYHQSHGVKFYDRVSVHKAFPEIQAAFDKAVMSRTFYELSKDFTADGKD